MPELGTNFDWKKTPLGERTQLLLQGGGGCLHLHLAMTIIPRPHGGNAGYGE
jgi:hypothetical protein